MATAGRLRIDFNFSSTNARDISYFGDLTLKLRSNCETHINYAAVISDDDRSLFGCKRIKM